MRIVTSVIPGIAIDVPADSAIFEQLVNDALYALSQRPVGAQLVGLPAAMQGNFGVASMHDCVWLIRRAAEAGQTGDARRLRYDSVVGWDCCANRAVRSGERQAATTGTTTRVEWNPNIIDTPDGARPPFIGLAHELVHAYRNLMGDAWLSREDEERQTVGIQGYYPVSENAVRLEWGLPIRRDYSFARASR